MSKSHPSNPADIFPRRLAVRTAVPSLADVAVARASASDVRSLARLLDLQLEARPEEVAAVAELRILQLEANLRRVNSVVDEVLVFADSHGPVDASYLRNVFVGLPR